jgi:hypothetical protein
MFTVYFGDHYRTTKLIKDRNPYIIKLTPTNPPT